MYSAKSPCDNNGICEHFVVGICFLVRSVNEENASYSLFWCLQEKQKQISNLNKVKLILVNICLTVVRPQWKTSVALRLSDAINK